LASNEQKRLIEKSSRSTRILDADYKPAILEDITHTCTNLNTQQITPKIAIFFYGTLGEFNIHPISLRLIDKRVKPVHVPGAVEH
jgi:hypothetical protein